MRLVKDKPVKKNYSLITLNVLLWLTVFGISTYLTYKMTTEGNDLYQSDYLAHISSALNGTGYSIMEIIMNILYRISGNTILISIFIGMLTTFTATAVLSLIRYLYDNDDSCTIMFSYGTLFLASIYIPDLNPYWYILETDKGNIISFLTQPWHNSTYVGMRLFAIISFAIFLKCWLNLDEGIKIKDLIMLCIMLSITNLFKPNFIISFAPAVLILFIVSLIMNHGKSWKGYIKISLAGIISMIPLIIQYKILFTGSDGGGWKISAERFITMGNFYGGFFVIATSLLFPVIITVLAVLSNVDRNIRQSILLAWIMEIISLFESLFMVETGARAHDGNFTWGIYCTTLILFIVCFTAFKKLIYDEKCKYKGMLTVSGWLLILHIINGFMYFGTIFKGFTYLS